MPGRGEVMGRMERRGGHQPERCKVVKGSASVPSDVSLPRTEDNGLTPDAAVVEVGGALRKFGGGVARENVLTAIWLRGLS